MGVLVGMKAICEYTHRSESTIIYWIQSMGFPAKKITAGVWESSAALIDSWREKMILENDQQIEQPIVKRVVNKPMKRRRF